MLPRPIWTLGPLYGHNAEEQKTIRTFQDGKIKPDAFTEPRLLGQPPGVCALIVSFNRFHNYVVQQLALINEAERFSIPVTVDPQNKAAYEKALAKRDERPFPNRKAVCSHSLWGCIPERTMLIPIL